MFCTVDVVYMCVLDCVPSCFCAALQDEESDVEKPEQTAAELEGLKVAHDAETLDAGETVILTLKDRNILEEGDDDAEELEDVLAVRLVPVPWLLRFLTH